jgi:Xaa-Pro aminopeptidase
MSAAPSDVEIPVELKAVAPATTPRRRDIDAKQERVARLLQDNALEGLLVQEPANFSWLTGGALLPAALDVGQWPAAYFTAQQRWIVCSNADTQWLFDRELDGLGFQLKEWPWHWPREQLLIDLTHGRKVGADRPVGECGYLGDKVKRERRVLSEYEQAVYRELGQTIAHALEATARNLTPGETEEEIAGQLCHRLRHRGADVVCSNVTSDERAKRYARPGTTPAPVRKYCLLSATARQAGLIATASRAVCFGPPPADLCPEFDHACRLSAAWLAGTKPGLRPGDLLVASRRLFSNTDYEHEWRRCPPGYCTGRAAVEQLLTPGSRDLFEADWAVTWQARVGSALICDTFVVTPQGPVSVTSAESWPIKRVRVGGDCFERPDLLIREMD